MWVAALSSVTMLASGCVGQPGDAPPITPSRGLPPLSEGVALAPDTYVLALDRYRITLTVPAGWEGWKYGVHPTSGAEPPSGRGLGFWIVDDIYADPCRWDLGLLEPPPEASAAGLAAALRAQWGRFATEPTTGRLNGRPAIEMDLTVPPDISFSDCAKNRGQGRGYFLYWPQRGGGGGRYSQGPGQREHLWILELDGARLVVNASYFPATSAAERDELWKVATSVRVS